MDASKPGKSSAMTNMEAEIDHEVWSTESDFDHVKKIMERASLTTPMDYVDRSKPQPAKPAAGATGWEATGRKEEKIGPITKERDRYTIMPEEAVMKIVANIDSNAITAEAMELT